MRKPGDKMNIQAVVFDAYGTLFDVAAAAREAAEEGSFPQLAKCWKALAADWRVRQLQYTWLRSLAGAHVQFWKVTEDGLDWALEAHGLDGDPALKKRLMELYWNLSAYPEVPDMLAALKAQGLHTAILSNGSPKMLDGAVQSAGIADVLDAVLSVEDVGIFKPAPEVYDLVTQCFGCAREEVLFVSSNGWDAACATGFGFETIWVNRAGEPMERLPWQPTQVMNDLTKVPEIAS